MTVSSVPEGKYADVVGDIRMHYHDDGDGSRGAVLFIHGSGPGASGWSNFKSNFPVLNNAGYRTLVPDSVGYGYSTKPESGEYSLDQVAEQYLGVVDAAGVDKVSLVGNSQGGAICIKFALNYPDRVDKLILMAPGGLEARETYMEMPGIKAMLTTIFKIGITKESMKKLFSKQLYDASKITDEVIDERYEIALTQPKDTIARIKVDNQEERLGELECPILCLWGVNDQFCPMSGAVKIAQRCKNSRTILISECGHWVMVEYPKLFNETLVRFLNDDLG